MAALMRRAWARLPPRLRRYLKSRFSDLTFYVGNGETRQSYQLRMLVEAHARSEHTIRYLLSLMGTLRHHERSILEIEADITRIYAMISPIEIELMNSKNAQENAVASIAAMNELVGQYSAYYNAHFQRVDGALLDIGVGTSPSGAGTPRLNIPQEIADLKGMVLELQARVDRINAVGPLVAAGANGGPVPETGSLHNGSLAAEGVHSGP